MPLAVLQPVQLMSLDSMVKYNYGNQPHVFNKCMHASSTMTTISYVLGTFQYLIYMICQIAAYFICQPS